MCPINKRRGALTVPGSDDDQVADLETVTDATVRVVVTNPARLGAERPRATLDLGRDLRFRTAQALDGEQIHQVRKGAFLINFHIFHFFVPSMARFGHVSRF